MNLTGIKDIDLKILNDLDDKSLVQYCTTNKEVVKYLVSVGAPDPTI